MNYVESYVNGSHIVALCIGDHGTKENVPERGLHVVLTLFWPMYSCVEQSSVYRCYGSVFARVRIHSQNLSVITYCLIVPIENNP